MSTHRSLPRGLRAQLEAARQGGADTASSPCSADTVPCSGSLNTSLQLLQIQAPLGRGPPPHLWRRHPLLSRLWHSSPRAGLHFQPRHRSPHPPAPRPPLPLPLPSPQPPAHHSSPSLPSSTPELPRVTRPGMRLARTPKPRASLAAWGRPQGALSRSTHAHSTARYPAPPHGPPAVLPIGNPSSEPPARAYLCSEHRNDGHRPHRVSPQTHVSRSIGLLFSRPARQDFPEPPTICLIGASDPRVEPHSARLLSRRSPLRVGSAGRQRLISVRYLTKSPSIGEVAR